jgi:hypothetical protein
MRRPDRVAKSQRKPSIEIDFERHVAGVAACLRNDYAKRHGTKVTRIPSATKQQIKRAAHIAAVMEVMQHRKPSPRLTQVLKHLAGV